jgi:hypothetical protein
MKTIISLDCDGVISNTYGFFEKTIKDRMGITPNESFYKAVQTGDFKSYENENGIKEGDLIKFFGSYEALLFSEIGSLEPMPKVVEGIRKLKDMVGEDNVADGKISNSN